MKKLRLAILVFVLVALVGSETAWASAPSAKVKGTAVSAWAGCKNVGYGRCANRPVRRYASNWRPPPKAKPVACQRCYTVRRAEAVCRNARCCPNRVRLVQQGRYPNKAVRCCWNGGGCGQRPPAAPCQPPPPPPPPSEDQHEQDP